MSDWVDLTVADLIRAGNAEVKTGPFGTQLRASDYVEEGTPVINVRNIGFGTIREEKLEYITEDTVQRLSSHILRPGDIVFGRKGAVERHAFIRDRHARWFQGSDCIRLRITGGEVNPRFISYCFLTEEHQQWIMAQGSHGATMASLNQDIIGRIALRLPPRSVQRRIVVVLSAYDDLIENNIRRIAVLEEMVRAIYREWFVEFRFPGHEQVEMVDSELGAVPEGWEVVRLKDCAHLTMGQSPKSEFYNDNGEGLPFHQGVSNFGSHFPRHRTFCTVQKRIADEGDILFSVRAPVGRINIADTKLIVGRGLSAIRHVASGQPFLLYQLKDRFREEDSMGGGTIFKSVTKRDMQELSLLEPTRHLIDRFRAIVAPMLDELRVLTNKNDNLRQTRDLLLPKLISGRIDVSEAEEELEAAAV